MFASKPCAFVSISPGLPNVAAVKRGLNMNRFVTGRDVPGRTTLKYWPGASMRPVAALEAITRFPCVGTFDLALAQLSAKGSETSAAEATLTIARTVLDLDPQKGKIGLQKLIDANINENVTAAAKELLQ